MNPKEYNKNALITEACDFDAIKSRLDNKMIRLLHASLGWTSELSELVDAINHDEIDYVNVAEELGDSLWYTAVAVEAMGFDPEAISKSEALIGESYLVVRNKEHLKLTVNGIVWAAGRFSDLIKKALMYGKPIDQDRAHKTLEALYFSIAGAAHVCETTLEEIRETNINKLKARYGEKFTESAALNRDLDTERKILEDGSK